MGEDRERPDDPFVKLDRESQDAAGVEADDQADRGLREKRAWSSAAQRQAYAARCSHTVHDDAASQFCNRA
jgi:hypothetical protein